MDMQKLPLSAIVGVDMGIPVVTIKVCTKLETDPKVTKHERFSMDNMSVSNMYQTFRHSDTIKSSCLSTINMSQTLVIIKLEETPCKRVTKNFLNWIIEKKSSNDETCTTHLHQENTK